jgi:hypothetical protein
MRWLTRTSANASDFARSRSIIARSDQNPKAAIQSLRGEFLRHHGHILIQSSGLCHLEWLKRLARTKRASLRRSKVRIRSVFDSLLSSKFFFEIEAPAAEQPFTGHRSFSIDIGDALLGS